MMTVNAWDKFICSESGAVTVDWLVLTAAIVGLGAVVVFQIKGPQDALAEQVGQKMTDGSSTLPDLDFE